MQEGSDASHIPASRDLLLQGPLPGTPAGILGSLPHSTEMSSDQGLAASGISRAPPPHAFCIL